MKTLMICLGMIAVNTPVLLSAQRLDVLVPGELVSVTRATKLPHDGITYHYHRKPLRLRGSFVAVRGDTLLELEAVDGSGPVFLVLNRRSVVERLTVPKRRQAMIFGGLTAFAIGGGIGLKAVSGTCQECMFPTESLALVTGTASALLGLLIGAVIDRHLDDKRWVHLSTATPTIDLATVPGPTHWRVGLRLPR